MRFGHKVTAKYKIVSNDARLKELLERAEENLFDADELEIERFEAKPEIEKIRHMYLQGECDAFAIAARAIFGGRVVSVTSDEYGSIHRLMRVSSGKLMDAAGWVTEKGLIRRYGLKDLHLTEGGDELLHFMGDDHDVILAAIAMLYLDKEPFRSNLKKIERFIKEEEARSR